MGTLNDETEANSRERREGKEIESITRGVDGEEDGKAVYHSTIASKLTTGEISMQKDGEQQ